MKALLNLVNNLRKQYSDEQSDELSESLQIHLASAIAANLKVPNTPNITAMGCWNQDHRAHVRRLVDEINELYIIDTNKVIDLIRGSFIIQYNLIHQPQQAVEVVNLIVGHLLEKGGDTTLAHRPFDYSLLTSMVTDVGQVMNIIAPTADVDDNTDNGGSE